MDGSGAAPNAESRKICWNARDKFLACCELYQTEDEQNKKCLVEKKEFENSCPKVWVSLALV